MKLDKTFKFVNKQINDIIYDDSEHVAINKLKKLIDMLLNENPKDSKELIMAMELMRKYIPNTQLIDIFEKYENFYTEKIKHATEKVKLLDNIFKSLIEKKGGAPKKQKRSISKKKRSISKKKRSISKKKKSVSKKKKSISKKKW
jgi:hypothetical protein